MDQPASRFGLEREALLARLFPAGFPTLWCPLITHYAGDGSIDRARMRAHIAHLAPQVGGFLLPGSTGDGWELDDAETSALIEIGIGEVARVKRKLLIGALRFRSDEVMAAISDALAVVRRVTGAASDKSAMDGSPVCGFTVCAPKGRELGQAQIRAALEAVLTLGLPTSLYQLPQITENEIAPQTVAGLAERFPNFYLFKDTSGADRVAAAGVDSIVMLRGAEGDYAQQLSLGGGRYDAFLLSTANAFAQPLAQIRAELEAGATDRARELSGRVSAAVAQAFALAQPLPYGNAFANANKALDHFFAFGPRAAEVPGPWLRNGQRLPQAMLASVGEALTRHRLMPETGYLVAAAA